MKTDFLPVKIAVEEWIIPTYPEPEAEEMPMFCETREHQQTSGNPYPARVVSKVERGARMERPYTVVCMENAYIRLAIIPELGGRIFEAYDKVTGYDFLYRQHVVKPALIGVYGSWISGGMEFNWPFHHRPSTMMPIDYTIETKEDGSAICWLSEHEPVDRTKGTVGIVLRPDASYFETRMQVTNRTPHKHTFLWWENAAVAVHEEYRLVFPPDVTWVHHHYDRDHTTFPIASGQYGADAIVKPKDISWHGKTDLSTSYFAAPSSYDFFGGFDYRKNCGVLHIANHHISPGKKMFTWGYGENADNWEEKLTDTDGAYAELMAGSYTDDQPDFTWIAPYETKTFSQFWYPTQGIGYTTYANLDAAVALDREADAFRVNVTSVRNQATMQVLGADGRILLHETADLTPSVGVSFPLVYPKGEKLTVRLLTREGKEILSYAEKDADYVHIPANSAPVAKPDELSSASELVIAGKHIDQYRDALYKPDQYYLEALKRDKYDLAALKALGEYYCRISRFEEALLWLDRAFEVECKYNQNPEDGSVYYYRGIALKNLGRMEEAYDAFYRASWSQNMISPAMTAVAALDGIRGDYAAMYEHAMNAVAKEAGHPLALPYAALALYKLGESAKAEKMCSQILEKDPLNHLVDYLLIMIGSSDSETYYDAMYSNPAQTVLDVAYDLMQAGFVKESVELLLGVLKRCPKSAMVHYTLAYCYDLLGDRKAADVQRKEASKEWIVEVFPQRAEEKLVLEAALKANPKDGFAAYLLGCLLYDRQVYEEAAKLFEQAVEYLPEFYIPYRNLALVYFNHLNRQEEALPFLYRAVELHPQDEMLLLETSMVMERLRISGKETVAYLEANRPAKAADQLTLAIARAYNRAGDYDRAEQEMLSHEFYPGEGVEFGCAEPYLFACFARGRAAMKEGRYEDALRDFQVTRQVPANLHVGFWNDSVLMPYRYYEAAVLRLLGREDEAKEIIDVLADQKDVGMWNMGGEFNYYSAMSVRLSGDEMRAQRIMRDAVLAWENQLHNLSRYYSQMTVGDFVCFTGSRLREERLGALYGMLGFGKLFDKDLAGAKALFEKSQELDPTGMKVALELSLLD